MTHSHRFTPSSNTGWKLFGALELPPGPNADQSLSAWLSESLSALNLPASIGNKIFTAARQAVERARQLPAAIPSRPIHLLLFAPEHSPTAMLAWGFFSMEKMGSAPAGQPAPIPTIEFYLYPEG